MITLSLDLSINKEKGSDWLFPDEVALLCEWVPCSYTQQ